MVEGQTGASHGHIEAAGLGAAVIADVENLLVPVVVVGQEMVLLDDVDGLLVDIAIAHEREFLDLLVGLDELLDLGEPFVDVLVGQGAEHLQSARNLPPLFGIFVIEIFPVEIEDFALHRDSPYNAASASA